MGRLVVVSTIVFSLMVSPCFAIEYCKDFLELGNPGGWSSSLKTFDDEWTMIVGDEVELDIWVNDVPLPLLSGGFWIEYDPSKVSIVSVVAYDGNDLQGPWEVAFTIKVPDAGGPGTYMLSVAPPLIAAAPDGDGDIIIAKIRFRCESEGDAIITISTIPGLDTFVGDTTVFDFDIFPNEVVIHQEIDYCEGDFDNDGDQDGSDAALFKTDFGRSPFNRPCPPVSTTTTIPLGCPYGMIDCGNKCVDPLTDRDYCGTDMNCLGGTVCGTGEICDGGFCILNCPLELTKCEGLCVDTDTDEDYCGSCTNNCASGEMCVLGTCEIVGGVVYKAAVEKTGQSTSYSIGDDGDLEEGVIWPNPRFTDNLDGTVRDNLTGLIWLKNANCFQQRTWNQALSDCNGLADGSCGLTDGSNAGDWRLPNKKELLSLTHYGYIDPALPNTTGTGQWDTGDPFIRVAVSYPTAYWSSTTFAGFIGYVWEVPMDIGNTSLEDRLDVNFVWPVRGGH